MLAVQRNHVSNNMVLGNNTFGIALSDFCTANQVPPDLCSESVLGIDPSPNGNRIELNIVLGNGLNPDSVRLPPGIPGADLLWTGVGTGNCWANNTSLINIWPLSPQPLPACH